ncbi:MAG: hypothetical protein KKH94_05615 [Candidatus Omnitrophica bacterium]|nr:hypothetical protein [Candidatus Omnitrophota bacterium]
MKKRVLKSLPFTQLTMFKIANRRGYAAMCRNNLTEGRTPYQAFARMNKALKRKGCVLKASSSSAIGKRVKKKI